jgi:hypothetical protein
MSKSILKNTKAAPTAKEAIKKALEAPAVKAAAKALTGKKILAKLKPITVVPPPVKAKAPETLRADPARTAANLPAAIKTLSRETAGAYDLASIADDGPGYGSRLRVLKALRGGERVAAKDAEPAKLRRELHAAMGATSTGAFVLKCAAMEAVARKASKDLSKRLSDSKKAGDAAKTAFLRTQKPILDGKPILDAPKKMNKKEEAADGAAFRAELAARVARATCEAAKVSVAVHRPNAEIHLDMSEVCILEDPKNGIVLLQLEKTNSQGAICVYNNGSRVAAGVVPTEVLRTLRALASSDLVRDVNQLLHPITAGVIVTPVAERHLTAVLNHCKENIMATVTVEKKSSKFAPPAGAAKKSAKNAKVAVDTKVKAVVKEKAPRAAATGVGGFDDAQTITVVAAENPYREGTKAFNTFGLFAKAKTVGKFREMSADKAQYETGYIRYSSRDGHIKIK